MLRRNHVVLDKSICGLSWARHQRSAHLASQLLRQSSCACMYIHIEESMQLLVRHIDLLYVGFLKFILLYRNFLLTQTSHEAPRYNQIKFLPILACMRAFHVCNISNNSAKHCKDVEKSRLGFKASQLVLSIALLSTEWTESQGIRQPSQLQGYGC